MIRLYYFIGVFLLFGLRQVNCRQHKYCHRRLNLIDGRGVSPKTYISTLNYTGVPCTYFDGNIVISPRIHDSSLNDPTLIELLNTIRVVTGFIFISVSHALSPRLQFNSLEVIYGRELMNIDGKSYSLYIEPKPSVAALQALEMPNLKAIENGDVGCFNFDLNICVNREQIAWNEILNNPTTQKVHFSDTQITNEVKTECSNSCVPINGIARCWGPEVDHCQQKTRCQKRGWKYCYYDANVEGEELCSEECVGGCYGRSEDKCFACAQYEVNGKCVASCPKGLFILDSLCVSECPEKMAIDNNACVNQCPPGFIMKEESRFCERCPPSGCHHKVCRLLDPVNDNHLELNSIRLAELTNCTVLQGSLLLSARAFIQDKGIPPIRSIKEFEALEKLEVVTGIVNLDFSRLNLTTSLYFLSRLREIQGRYRGVFNKKQSLLVANAGIDHLGLQSLESVTGGDVLFYKTENLVYGLSVNWTMLGVSNPAQAVPKGKIVIGKCDPKCNPEWGCVGPGPTMCLRCLEWRASNHLCVSNCSLAPRHYTPTSEVRNADLIAKRKCGLCHSECAESCVGPQSTQCVGSCVNKKYDDTCVPKCPHNTYSEDNSKFCQRCSTDCHNRTITQKPVCYGPSSNDCNKCHVLIYDSPRNRTCRPVNQHCPSSFYSVIVTEQNCAPEVLPYIEEGGLMEVCYKCTPPCTECTSSTKCQFCSGVWLDGKCLKECSSERIPSKYRNHHIGVNQSCITCDDNCKGGCTDTGPTDCFMCRDFSVEVNVGNTTGTKCVKQCPDKTFANDRGWCTTEDKTIRGQVKKTLIILFSVVVPIVLLVIILILICAFLGWKGKHQYKEEKQRIHEIYCNAFDGKDSLDTTMNNRAINLSRLEFIQSDELIMDTSKILGSGAFGEVFKADWSISEDKLQKRMSEYGKNSALISTIGSTFFRTSTLRSGTQQRLRQIEVAVKRISALKSGAAATTRDEIFAEAQVMASVKHPNCLPLIGICMSEGYLITAYMPKGSLDRYLYNYQQYLDANVMFLWCQQIADGMNYLTEQGIIHRDLAARNVLLKDHEWAMITDFGLSKMLESESQREVVIVAGKVPIRWLAVETLRHGIYSAATDIWSYGVTIWEIFSFAEMPYTEMETLAVRDYVLEGKRLNKPIGLSDQVFLEMYKCWAEDSESRPTFNLLKMKFKAFGQCAQNHFENPHRIFEEEPNDSILRETNSSRRHGQRSVKKSSNDKSGGYPYTYTKADAYAVMSQPPSVNFDKIQEGRYENLPEQHELLLQKSFSRDAERQDGKPVSSPETSPYSDTSEPAYSPTPLYPNNNEYC